MLIDPRTLAVAGEDGTVTAFNQYYRFRMPMNNGYLVGKLVTDFQPFTNTEFVTDFIEPRRITRCLAGGWFRHYASVISLCRHARLFTDREIAISQIISPHLENFYDILSLAAANPEQSRLHALKADVLQAGLTKREQEVALLLAQRLSTAEIADRLFISPRTVEKHAENIYIKLGVRKKREVAQHLLNFRPYSTSL